MITPITFKRAGIEYELYKGVENGKTTEYIQTVEPDVDGLRTRIYCVSLYIDTDRSETTGSFTSIKTEWMKTKVSPAGNVLRNYSELETMITKVSEVELFNTMFGPNFLAFMVNGFVRDNMGFNHLPVIDTRPTIDGLPNPNFGLPMVYDEFLENTQPTRDYSSWNTGDDLPDSLTPPEEE